MNEDGAARDFNSLVVNHTRKDFPILDAKMSVAERVIYFDAVDEDRRLAGVLPTRPLLTAALDARVEQIMIPRVVALLATATVLDACEFFVLYKFFAFLTCTFDWNRLRHSRRRHCLAGAKRYRGALVIGGSIAISLVSACLFGLGVPSLRHRFKLDPKIAAGPITLALADFTVLLIYFTSARLVWG